MSVTDHLLRPRLHSHKTSKFINPARPEKMAALLQMTYSITFTWVKLLWFDSNVVLKGVIENDSSVVQVMWQAITWTSDDADEWSHVVSLGHKELIHFPRWYGS